VEQVTAALPANEGSADIAPEAIAPARPKGMAASLVETTKPGITRLVTITSMVGFIMAGLSRGMPFSEMLGLGVVCMLGTALSAAGANAVNQWMERDRDALMPRTQRRPLPQGRVAPAAVLATGVTLCITGVAVLLLAGPLPSLISLACIVSYVAFYTPMKTRSTLATFIGAIPGALPPLIGWTAASTGAGFSPMFEAGGLALFSIMFIWQIPHFMAIAWMYKEDYRAGGYLVLPVVDERGLWTALTVALWTMALIPATLFPARVWPELLGTPYIIVAGLSAVAFGAMAVRLIVARSRSAARTVFFASIMHLPLLLLAMVVEAVLRKALA
jgi:protoheme IX farnesyltransferase